MHLRRLIACCSLVFISLVQHPRIFVQFYVFSVNCKTVMELHLLIDRFFFRIFQWSSY